MCGNIRKNMQMRGLDEEYKNQIKSLYILHTLFRVENAMLWINFPHNKKEVVIRSLYRVYFSEKRVFFDKIDLFFV